MPKTPSKDDKKKSDKKEKSSKDAKKDDKKSKDSKKKDDKSSKEKPAKEEKKKSEKTEKAEKPAKESSKPPTPTDAAPAVPPPPTGPTGEAGLLAQVCRDHPPNTVKFYCESCRMPCCGDCRAIGAHQGLAHVCVGLAEAFRTKRGELQNLVDGVLRSRQDALAAQVRRVEERVASVRIARAAIERETRAEYDSILDRLAAQEARKLATLHGDLAALQSDLDSVHSLEQRIGASADDGSQLLATFDDAASACERVSAKPIPSSIEVRADDFTREVALRKQQLSKAQQTSRLLRVKDMLTQSIIEEANAARTDMKAVQSAQLAQSEELQQWVSLNTKLSSALKRFDRGCHFCGVTLSPDSVNTPCRRNARVPPVSVQSAVSSSSTSLPTEIFGTSRHFFVSQ